MQENITILLAIQNGMNDHQKCVCGNGHPCCNMPPAMSDHFGLDLGVAVQRRHYCIKNRQIYTYRS